MKKLKKVMALVITMAMVVAMALPAMAADNYTLTVNNTVSGHTYTAYQIFTGTKATTGQNDDKLGDPAWGSDITAAGKTALLTEYRLAENATPQQVLDAIADKNGTASESDKAVRFANVFFTTDSAGNVTAKSGLLTGGSAQTASGTSVTFNNLASGYYLVNDSYTPEEGSGEQNGIDYSIARIAVQVVGNTTINNKADKPTVDKKIKGATAAQNTDKNTAQIGDTVPYVVTSKVPEYVGYKEYYLDFKDTLSKGLTLDQKTTDTTINNGIKITVGGTQLSKELYTVTVGEYSSTTGTNITIHIKDLVSRSTTFPVGAEIKIEYDATVNDNAVIGNAGNPNTMTLEYSNNPLNSGDGTPDNPDDDIPHGTTPESKTYTFVTEIEIIKIGDNDTSKTLAGAVFQITGTTMNKVLKVGQRYVEVDGTTGAYYKLTDGTYTDKAPTETTISNYANVTNGAVTKTYNLTAYAETDASEDESDKTFEIVSGSDGKIKITGLKEGTYTIREIQAPTGYNLMTDEIKVEVASNIDTITKPADFKWTKGAGTTVELKMEADSTTNVDNGTYQFNINNQSGTELPETGGIGTTIFYIVGAILVLGAGVVMVTRRRMDA